MVTYFYNRVEYLCKNYTILILSPSITLLLFITIHTPILKYKLTNEVVSTIQLEQITKNVSEKNKIMHALAHIEYNAMKSYIDTLVRFIHDVPQ